MKIRLDYVTNSSSSSFLIARKKELTEKQKEQLLTFAEDMLGKPVASTKEELDAYYEEYYDADLEIILSDRVYYDKYKKALDAINKGLTIYQGRVSFEDDFMMHSTYKRLFEATDDKDGNYIPIDTDLSY